MKVDGFHVVRIWLKDTVERLVKETQGLCQPHHLLRVELRAAATKVLHWKDAMSELRVD